MVISWDKSTDDTTPADALRYNVYAKTGSSVYSFFPANTETGELAAGTNGVRPLISGTSFTLKGFLKDDTEFGVQAVDNANMASAFTVYSTTAVNPVMNSLKVNVYGFDKTIVIRNNQNGHVNYRVMTINGKVVMNGICNSNSRKELNMTLPGIYLIQVSDHSSVSIEKVVLY